MPLFDAVFTGFNRGITRWSEVVGRRSVHPATVALVLELMLSNEASPVVVEASALLLFTYLFRFQPCSFNALTLEHVRLLSSSVLEVTETTISRRSH